MAARRGLSRDEILDAALAIADADGLSGVGMRSVAQQLGVTPMALYRHVGDKGSLLDGLVERVLREIELPPAGLPPADRLRALGSALRTVARRHPQAFGLLLARSAVTPEALQVRDAVVTALADLGVPEEGLSRAERLLSTFALGFAASEANGRFPDQTRADADFAHAMDLISILVEHARTGA